MHDGVLEVYKQSVNDMKVLKEDCKELQKGLKELELQIDGHFRKQYEADEMLINLRLIPL
jgi:hypothetical protein